MLIVDTLLRQLQEGKNQIRSASSPCGGEKEAGKSLKERTKKRKGEVSSTAGSLEINGAGVTKALKRASKEWFPPQQMWLESGVFGCGVVSWHPESLCVSICVFVTGGRPDMHEICNKSAATAANAATLTVNWAIERIHMRSSQNKGNNANSTVPLRLLALRKSSVLSL